MFQIRLIAFMAVFVLFPVNSAQAGGGKSPEALGMALVNAFRSGDAVMIVALHHYDPTPTATVAAQQNLAMTEWRKLISQYGISGYRVTTLSGKERQRFNAAKQLSLLPVKKLVINLVARQGSEQSSVNCYIGSIGGLYFFITRSD